MLDDAVDLAGDARGVVVEVDRVDVLVLLRRVLGVGDRPVGAGGEPLRVAGHPGMVRRRLQRQVEGDLEPELGRPGHEAVEVLEGAEVGVDRVVPAVAGADRPGRAGVVGPGGERVVRPLAVDLADRVDRRQVDHVEAHRRHALQPLGRGLEVAAGDLAGDRVAGRALGAREELVPAAVERTLAVGVRRMRALDGQQLAQRVRVEHRADVAGLELGQPRLHWPVGVAGGRDRAAQDLGGVGGDRVLDLGDHSLEQQRALEEHQLDVDPGRDLDAGVVLPGGERVGPRVHLERPGAGQVGRHPGLVPVDGVAELAHPDGWSPAAVRGGEHHLGAQLVVALAEHRRRHRERLTHGRLRCLPALVHQRHDVENGDATDHASTLANSNAGTQTTPARRAPAVVEQRAPASVVETPSSSSLGAARHRAAGGRAASASERRRDRSGGSTTPVGLLPTTGTAGGRAASASERRRDPRHRPRPRPSTAGGQRGVGAAHGRERAPHGLDLHPRMCRRHASTSEAPSTSSDGSVSTTSARGRRTRSRVGVARSGWPGRLTSPGWTTRSSTRSGSGSGAGLRGSR